MGTGTVPVRLPVEDRRLRMLWIEADSRCESLNGWHFVLCPDCQPEATRLLHAMGYQEE
jgi:hypothetical protein